MAIFKSFNDLVVSYIEYLRLVQPELDTKPGTVARDVFIDAQAQQLANLYSQLKSIADLQSLFSASGSDIDKLASNYGASRISGSASTGTVVFTTNNMDVDVLIPRGSVVTARNGVNFETLSDTILRSDSANVYRANAVRMRADLALASITDEFAIETTVQALTSGISGNIGRFYVVSHNIDSISNVTNISSFSGGNDSESDDEFVNRILSIFSGSNTGTALGYSTALSVVPGISDSEIVVPGDPLLIRDGTQVTTNSVGELAVSDPGSGGKVDIYTLGSDLVSEIDSFIYNDKSGNDDPINTINDFILGQKGESTTLNAAQRRVSLISADDLPYQPIDSVTGVSGSSSGSNFIEKYTDTDGAIKGNYELIKDTGDFGGSPFGFDKLHWISNTISLDAEDVSKGIFNGSDGLSFTDISGISEITQDYLVTNENPILSSSSRSSLTLRHTPIRSVSRIVNLTTGERYLVSNQNPDGSSGSLNETGRITITGSTLPVSTDTLQVDYTWVKKFDSNLDFDNISSYNSLRTAQDSVDWGFGNLVKDEPATITNTGGVFTVSVSHPVYSVISVNILSTSTSIVNNGTINVGQLVSNVIDIRRVSDGAELFNTDSQSGALTGTSSIILPTDSLAEDGDSAVVRFNSVDVYSPDGYSGSFNDATITLPDSGLITGNESVLVNYIADVNTLISEREISTLPAIGYQNTFLVDGSYTGEQPTSNVFGLSGNYTKNLRRAATNVIVNATSIPAEGSIVVSGTALNKIEDAIVVVTSGSGYQVDLRSAILSDINSTSVPNSIAIARLIKLERVNVNSSGVIQSVDNVYDTINYKLNDNSFDLDKSLKNSSLNTTSVELPRTTGNSDAILVTGDIVRVSFYYTRTGVVEQLFYSRNGVKITDNIFSYINRISLGSGFRDATGTLRGNIEVKNYNQPVSNTPYSVDYNYIAPKENERITITFNYNAIVNSATKAIENVRPITADVLVKSAIEKSIDVNIKIVLLSEYISQEQTVIQDAIDVVTNFLNASSLGTTVDASDIVNVLYSVSGIDRVSIISFSTNGTGNVLSITASKNQYLSAGAVTIQAEVR